MNAVDSVSPSSSETLYDLSKRNKCKQIRMWILIK